MESKNFLVDSRDRFSQYTLNRKLDELMEGVTKKYNRVAVVCIGTDACTGDCFGPLVGLMLSRWTIIDFDLYGTIHQPVHAKNLEETLSKIDLENTLVIGVDASLGKLSHIGSISLGCSPIKPGSGLGRSLPEVGDIHVAGIVNISGFFPLLVLQNTRLSVVYSMAEMTARAIQFVLYKRRKKQETAC